MAPPGIQMTQINLHHSKSVSAILARNMAVMHTIVKGLNAIFLPQLSSKDLTVIKIRVKLAEEEDMEVLIGSVYMLYDSMDDPPPKEVKALIAYAEAGRLELLLSCDANSHHVEWKSANINPRGESLHSFLEGTGLTILNRRNEPTFLDSRRQEVIDITVSRFVTQKTNWEGFRADLKAQFVEAPTSFRTKNNLENAADFLKNAIANVYELNCSLKPRSPVTKIHWWNKELEKLRFEKETRRKFSKAKRTRLAARWEAFRSSQREYSKEIKKAKYKSWKHFCGSIESAPEAFRLHRILSLDHRPQLGCLKLPTENVTEEASDTLKHLMEIHFPGFDKNIQPRRPKPRAWSGTRVVFIPGPGRNGYISSKDFRPISLTSFVFKTLERLIDGFLKNGPLLTYPLASSQYAYKEGRSKYCFAPPCERGREAIGGKRICPGRLPGLRELLIASHMM
ncbi:uncharacterized protein LOC109861980 [Pseudomyrmex gracilis]|uniref:uncharacterized protein LOC109861980 n=1 Tax=Pseudomyrmex gracilis TaxID=219809 RepID=UPI000994B5FE|nr:uncharacterized protein LOC109861980 [Pseudomyrmex gracilis]